MSNVRPNPLVRLLPSMTDVAFVLPAAFLFLVMQGARTMLGDGDTGWHVRAGEWMLQNGRVPHTDMFSYTMPGQPWFAWEWLWELSFGWLHQHWGMSAVVLASILVLCLTFALLFRLIRRKCGNVFLALGVTAMAAAGCSIHYLARPHLFTFLFVVLFVWILELASEGRRRLLWLLPALMVVWTNVHGGFLIGLFLTGAYTAGELAAWVFDSDGARRPEALGRSKWFLIAAAGCALATFANPYGYHLHEHIYQYLSDPGLYQGIQEFRPLDFQGPIALFAEPMLLLGILAAVWNLYRRRFTYTFLILAWAHLALFSARNLPIYLLIAAPLIAEMLEELVHVLQGAAVRGWIQRAAAGFDALAVEFGAVDRLPRVPVASAVAAVLLGAALYAPAPAAKFRAEYDPARYPKKALAVLRGSESRRIFTHDEWGDYLIYNLYPSKKVFVDGRSDFYGTAFGEKYLDVMRVKSDWEQNLSRYSVDTILLPVDESLAGALKQSRKWRVVYDDGMAIVFRSVGPSQQFASSVVEHRISGSFENDMRNKGVAGSRNSSRMPAQSPGTRS